jgi:hypothetical protein
MLFSGASNRSRRMRTELVLDEPHPEGNFWVGAYSIGYLRRRCKRSRHRCRHRRYGDVQYEPVEHLERLWRKPPMRAGSSLCGFVRRELSRRLFSLSLSTVIIFSMRSNLPIAQTSAVIDPVCGMTVDPSTASRVVRSHTADIITSCAVR